nr:hypothetical protein [Tanacetum cinerariifolium]
MLIFSEAPLFLWAEAINTACYTQNRSLIRLRYNKTPYELMQNKKPDLSFLHIFGSLCYPTNAIRIWVNLMQKQTLGFLDDWDRLFQPLFDEYFNPPTIGVSPVQEAVAPRAKVLANSPVSISITHDAPSTSIPSSQEQEHSPIISQGSSSNVIQINTPFKHLDRWTKDHPIANVIGDPSRSIDAMQEETHEFERLEVWELVSCPDNVFLIKLKWIYKVKIDESGGLLKSEARLIAQGFRQEEGIDSEESFAPDNPSHVYKLKKALYGLKQAPHTWYDMLSSFIISQQFSKGKVDPTLFTRHAGYDLLLVQINVNDIKFASSNTAMCDEFANQMM